MTYLSHSPIHRKVGGGLVAIKELSFLDSGFKIEEELLKDEWVELLSKADVICRLENQRCQARQKELLPELDWNAALKMALRSNKPDEYSRVMMAGLKALGTPGQEAGQLLRKTAWLPLREGGLIKPADIIHINGVEEEIHRILKKKSDGICGSLALEEWILNHPGFPALKQQFPRAKEALEMLGLWLSQKAEMKLGLRPDNLDSVEECKEFVEVFKDCPYEIMAAIPLLSALLNHKVPEIAPLCCEQVIPSLADCVEAQNMKQILLFLTARHKEAPLNKKKVFIKWFNSYLRQAVKDNTIKSFLSEILLLNQIGQWHSPSLMAPPSEGISEKDQLDILQAEILLKKDYEPAGALQTNSTSREEELQLCRVCGTVTGLFCRNGRICPTRTNWCSGGSFRRLSPNSKLGSANVRRQHLGNRS